MALSKYFHNLRPDPALREGSATTFLKEGHSSFWEVTFFIALTVFIVVLCLFFWKKYNVKKSINGSNKRVRWKIF